MKVILLTQGKVALVDDEDFEELSKHKWYAHRCWRSWYAERRDASTGKIVRMHQVLLGTQEGFEIDHKDIDGLNNQRQNLRFLSHAHNGVNTRKCEKPCSSKYKGVSFDKGRKQWAAYLWHGTRQSLGRFSTEEAAARAYDRAAIRTFGEGIARLNFPQILLEEE